MIDLTPSQNRMAATAVAVAAFAVVLAFVLVIGWAALRFLELASPALTPVMMGVFLSLLFKPYYEWFKRRLRNPVLALVVMSATVLAPVVLLTWGCGAFLVEQFMALMAAAPTVTTRLSAWTVQQFPSAPGLAASLGLPAGVQLFFTDPAGFSHGIVAQVTNTYGSGALKVGVDALKYLSSVGTVLLSLVFFVYFLMRPSMSGADYVKEAPFLKEATRDFIAEQIDSFLGILVSFFQRQVLICLIEGCLYGVGFMAVGLPYGFVLGFLLGALNLVPLLGTILVMPLALPLAFFGDGGSVLRLALVATVWVSGQVLDGYCITPTIQGNKTGLGFAGVIFSFIFWGVVFNSMLGLLLAIPLSAFCVVLWRAVKQKYVKGVI